MKATPGSFTRWQIPSLYKNILPLAEKDPFDIHDFKWKNGRTISRYSHAATNFHWINSHSEPFHALELCRDLYNSLPHFRPHLINSFHIMNTPDQGASALDFWESAFSKKRELVVIDKDFYARKGRATQKEFAALLGDVNDLDVLDIGCGSGELSVYLANLGAKVTSTDFSENAIKHTESLAIHNRVIERIDLVQTDALDLPDLPKRFDLIVGRFVLHHIEPFSQFVEVLYEMINKSGGRGVFMENNAANPFLMFARKYLAGKMGIPKYGDDDEYPLEPREIDMLVDKFDQVHQHFPELIFFRKLNTYLFRHKKKYSPFMRVNDWLDDTVYRSVSRMRKLSYLQLVEIVKKSQK